MGVLVQTHNLTKQYGQQRIVNNVNLSVKKGEIYGLIGRNGAGKTTVLRLIGGLTRPTGGSIYLSPQAMSQAGTPAQIFDGFREGQPPRCRRPGSWFGQNSLDTTYMQKSMGLLIESPGIYSNMNAKNNVKLKCLAMGISCRSYITELLESVGLSAASTKKVKHFSVGMKQRLGIALALAGNPELVILDEPINGLDPQGMAEIREMITRLNKEKGITFIISSHILGELSKIADSYGILEKGELKKQIRKTELTEDLEEYFLSLTGGVSHG